MTTQNQHTRVKKHRMVLTVKEVSEMMGWGLQQTYEACNTGVIPAVKRGRRIVVGRKALDRLLLEGNIANDTVQR